MTDGDTQALLEHLRRLIDAAQYKRALNLIDNKLAEFQHETTERAKTPRNCIKCDSLDFACMPSCWCHCHAGERR